MINNQSIEINRTAAINSIVRTRDIAGNPLKVMILAHTGNLVRFTDEKGEKYALPEQVKIKKLTDIEEIFTLKEAWEHFGAEPFDVESAQGESLRLTLQGVSHERYGYPQDNFVFQENNLIIELAPEVKESTVEGTLAAAKIIIDNFTPPGYTRKEDDGGEESFVQDLPKDC